VWFLLFNGRANVDGWKRFILHIDINVGRRAQRDAVVVSNNEPHVKQTA
jgi:hypothetical protein